MAVTLKENSCFFGTDKTPRPQISLLSVGKLNLLQGIHTFLSAETIIVSGKA
jgi:hypothetical protein